MNSGFSWIVFTSEVLVNLDKGDARDVLKDTYKDIKFYSCYLKDGNIF
jgi:hypothetical protein